MLVSWYCFELWERISECLITFVLDVFFYLFFLFVVLYGHVHDHKEAFVFKLCSR